MKNVAFKVSFGDPNLPNGFITDHFGTDENSVDGYQIAPLEVFNNMIQNNITLVRQWEATQGVIPADPNAPPVKPRSPNEAQHLPPDLVAKNDAQVQQSVADAQLFQQFLAWKRAQGNGS